MPLAFVVPPGGAVAPPPQQSQNVPQDTDCEKKLVTMNVARSLLASIVQPVYTTKRRWSGIDVTVAPFNVTNAAGNASPFSVQVWGIYSGLRVLIMTGQYNLADYNAGNAGVTQPFNPIAKKIVSVRSATCEAFDITITSQSAGALNIAVGILASNDVNSIDPQEAGAVGAASSFATGLAPQQLQDLRMPGGGVYVGSSSSPGAFTQPITGLGVVTAAGAGATWWMLFPWKSSYNPVTPTVPNGTVPDFCAPLPLGGGGLDLLAALRGRRYGPDPTNPQTGSTGGGFVACASSTPGTLTGVGAGVAFGDVLFR